MRSAAIRILMCAALLLCGFGSSAAVAGPVDPIGTVTSAVSTVLSQTTVVSDLTGSATGATSGSGATGSVSGAADSLPGSDGTGSPAGSAISSPSSSSDGGGSSSSPTTDGGSSSRVDSRSGTTSASSSRGSPRTRFDRLPGRYEVLLERIEFGHRVRANLARLRALLVSASPELRTRISRLIRLEIRRLQRGGLTRRERAAVRRLRHLIQTMHRLPVVSPTATAAVPLARLVGGGVLSATAGGVPSANGVGATALPASESPRDATRLAMPKVPQLPAPGSPSSRLWLLVLALALTCFFLFLIAAAAPRNSIHPLVRGIAALARPDTVALALVLFLGLVLGAGVTLLLLLLH